MELKDIKKLDSIADCADEIWPFIDEILPVGSLDSELQTENIEAAVPADFLYGPFSTFKFIS